MAGNANSGRRQEKPFRDALMLAVKAAESADDPKALRKVAEKLLSEAAGGNVQAITAIRDTLDGKPAQAIIGGDDNDQPVKLQSTVTLTIVDPKSEG